MSPSVSIVKPTMQAYLVESRGPGGQALEKEAAPLRLDGVFRVRYRMPTPQARARLWRKIITGHQPEALKMAVGRPARGRETITMIRLQGRPPRPGFSGHSGMIKTPMIAHPQTTAFGC
jgi:hypothetical protein